MEIRERLKFNNGESRRGVIVTYDLPLRSVRIDFTEGMVYTKQFTLWQDELMQLLELVQTVKEHGERHIRLGDAEPEQQAAHEEPSTKRSWRDWKAQIARLSA